MSRIISSVWGPSMKKSRMIYTAVTRPIMTYGIQSWAAGPYSDMTRSNTALKTQLKGLKKVQNACLRKVLSVYRRTPSAIMEREAAVPPLDLYAEELALL